MKKWNELAKARMKEIGITQEQLAERLGVTQGAVAHWVSGRREPDLETIGRVLATLGLPAMQFGARLAAPIESNAEIIGAMSAWDMEMADLATPRSRAVLQRINQAATDGRLSEADINLLDQIAARFESRGASPAQHSEGSHKRLRDKLQNDDPHSKK